MGLYESSGKHESESRRELMERDKSSRWRVGLWLWLWLWWGLEQPRAASEWMECVRDFGAEARLPVGPPLNPRLHQKDPFLPFTIHPHRRTSSDHMYDAEQAQPGPSQQIMTEKGHHSRHSNWDLGLVTGFRRLEHDYEDFDPRNAKEAHLVYADGDLPKNRVSNYRSDARAQC